MALAEPENDYKNFTTDGAFGPIARERSARLLCYNQRFLQLILASKSESKLLKRALVAILAAVLLLVLAACGGNNNNNTGSSASTALAAGVTKRALISDKFNGVLYITDAAKDLPTRFRISVGTSASLMALMPDKKHTIVIDPASNNLVVTDNTTETIASSVTLPAFTESIAPAPDNKTIYVAVRNAPVSGQLPGFVEVVDITATSGTTFANIPVPTVRRIVLSHNGNKLLAFSDNSNNVAVIDTASKAVTYVSGFDHPVFGVFSTDDNTAYILSCGQECGGTAAKVNTLSLANNVVGADVIVSGATTALLDGGNLYVAGNNAGGKLDVVATSSMTVSKSAVAITDGYHSKMALANSLLFIGSTGCNNITSGCLSVYNTSSSAVVNSAAGTGDVTGIQPITGRNIVYVVEGGEFVIWDTTTVAPLPAAKQFDIVGQAYDVTLID
jgi:hypothetical protein